MKKWELLNKESGKGLGIDNITKILLDNRGIKTKKEIEEFLDPKLEDVSVESVGIDKKQLVKALNRIREAIKRNEKIIIYGDYDVDGICATTILWETLYASYKQSFSSNKNVFPYIPHRVDEGYGLSIRGIDNIKDAKLIITVDNGIVASEAVEFAKKQGIDVIITDHHVSEKQLPNAYSIVHTTKLCGAGVAYLLAKELKTKNLKLKTYDNDNYLELVAIATVADLVPLLGANRVLVKFGIERLRDTQRIGLLELFKEARLDKKTIGVYEIGHIISPRLNAMGRLMHAMDSVRLLCTKDVQRAKKLAQKLCSINRERQVMTDESTEHAKSLLSKTVINRIAFVAHEDYNQGVIGLIASKLVEEFYRPSFAISIGDEFSKGSARSVRGVNIIELIRSVSHTLVQVGGHPMAAGFTVETKRIEEFRLAIEEKASELITDDHLMRGIRIDMPLRFSQINLDVYSELQKLSPFGMGNPEPVFMTKDVIIEDMRLMGRESNHVKFRLSQSKLKTENLKRSHGSFLADSKIKTFEGIAFNMADKASDLHIGDKIDVAYTIDLNEWNGNKKLQLKVRDFRVEN